MAASLSRVILFTFSLLFLSNSATAAPNYETQLLHPRLLMPARRARLLQRERERETMRWNHFHGLINTGVEMPEKGFALALYYVASKSDEHGRKAIEWALSPAADLRQMAIVYDWCEPLLKPEENKRLTAKILQALERQGPAHDLGSVRDRVFGALAIGGETPGSGEKFLKPIVEDWWKRRILSPIEAGENPISLSDHLAFVEMLHALRDNLDIDLRETAPKYFTTIPGYHILAHYPAPYPAAENDYRVPLMKSHGEPDAREAVRSRAAALSMVALDTNSQEMQFLQGWLMLDRFLMRSSYGITYEFLWANPYQPGLSFHYLPNVFHDPRSGRLIIRSSWEDDAFWYYQSGGELQSFRDGQIVNLKQNAIQEPVAMGTASLIPAAKTPLFEAGGEEKSRVYCIGLKPLARYDLEIDDEEIREVHTDRGGVAELEFPPGRKKVVRLKLAPVQQPVSIPKAR